MSLNVCTIGLLSAAEERRGRGEATKSTKTIRETPSPWSPTRTCRAIRLSNASSNAAVSHAWGCGQNVNDAYSARAFSKSLTNKSRSKKIAGRPDLAWQEFHAPGLHCGAVGCMQTPYERMAYTDSSDAVARPIRVLRLVCNAQGASNHRNDSG